jgi:hypothetical protein
MIRIMVPTLRRIRMMPTATLTRPTTTLNTAELSI